MIQKTQMLPLESGLEVPMCTKVHILVKNAKRIIQASHEADLEVWDTVRIILVNLLNEEQNQDTGNFKIRMNKLLKLTS